MTAKIVHRITGDEMVATAERLMGAAKIVVTDDGFGYGGDGTDIWYDEQHTMRFAGQIVFLDEDMTTHIAAECELVTADGVRWTLDHDGKPARQLGGHDVTVVWQGPDAFEVSVQRLHLAPGQHPEDMEHEDLIGPALRALMKAKKEEITDEEIAIAVEDCTLVCVVKGGLDIYDT